MFVPVSPSGTGKTLSRLTSSWLAVSQLRLPSSACLKSCPSTRSPVPALGSAAILVHPLDEYVHVAHGYAEKALDCEADRALEVVSDLGYPRSILNNHVDVDDELPVRVTDVDPLVHVLAPEQLGNAVAETAGGHAHDAVAAHCGMAGDRGHHARKDLDAAPFMGTSKPGGAVAVARLGWHAGIGGVHGGKHPYGTIRLRAFRYGRLWPPVCATDPEQKIQPWPEDARSAAKARSTD